MSVDYEDMIKIIALGHKISEEALAQAVVVVDRVVPPSGTSDARRAAALLGYMVHHGATVKAMIESAP